MGLRSWVCSACKQDKDETQWRFWKNNRRSTHCNDCYRHVKRKDKYKISLDESRSIEHRLCEICDKRQAQVVDHCHSNGHTRGFLCYPCNTILGFSSDSSEILMKAAEYLSARVASPEQPSISLCADGSLQPLPDTDADESH